MAMLSTDETNPTLRTGFDTSFTWDYARTRTGLDKLYEKAKASQWNGSTDLDWSIEVDPLRDAHQQAQQLDVPIGYRARYLADLPGSPIASWGEKEFEHFAVESQKASISQFLHGEQGALVCTARIVESVPWIEAKYYASTQVVDEARHVEVFARYLDEKLGGQYAMNENLNKLVSDVLTDERWDIVYMGMQVVIEGLALAAFGMMRTVTADPLLSQLLKYVMADEARHVAFGILSLQEYYEGLDAAEMRLRQEFCYEAVDLLRRRTVNTELWEALGVDPQWIYDEVLPLADQRRFQGLVFSKIVPNCKKLGLLDAGDSWLRDKFGEIGILKYEDYDAGDGAVEFVD